MTAGFKGLGLKSVDESVSFSSPQELPRFFSVSFSYWSGGGWPAHHPFSIFHL